MSSTLERAFLTRWEQLTRDLDPQPKPPVAQCYFHLEREWRFDFGWIDSLVLVDLQGGGWVRGAHNRELGMVNDFHKHNAALTMGWKPFLATTSMIEDDPESFINLLLDTMKQPLYVHNAELSMWTARIKNLNSIGAEIDHNGIYVRRERKNCFSMRLSGKEYRTEPEKYLIDGQKKVLSLILSGGVSTPADVKRSINVQTVMFS